jgi:hypothetical protein
VSVKRNPKQEGMNLFDCIPQKGPCPYQCNQCFFNRPGAYYVPLDQMPLIPTPEEVGDGIVRVNCGNDSNNQRELVIDAARQYKRCFFNTSVPCFDFPGPVVFTANAREEEPAVFMRPIPDNLMFVRLRTSGTNLLFVDGAVDFYTRQQVPVVITFMAYYDRKPEVSPSVGLSLEECYTWKIRHINSYWCPTPAFMQRVMARYLDNRLVSMCSSLNSSYCRDCRNCETYYFQTMKRMRGE